MLSPLKIFREPIFTEVIEPRPAALMIAGAGALQLALSCTIQLGFPCPFHWATGCPCPGCGLTRSILALGRGDLAGSFNLHPFGTLLLGGLVISLVAGVLPGKVRERLLAGIAAVESQTGITMILLVAFMVVWGLRVAGVVRLAPV